MYLKIYFLFNFIIIIVNKSITKNQYIYIYFTTFKCYYFLIFYFLEFTTKKSEIFMELICYQAFIIKILNFL